MLLNFATQRDPEYFPNPDAFSPERWIDNDGTNPFIYVPFSAGPRNCIGMDLVYKILNVFAKD